MEKNMNFKKAMTKSCHIIMAFGIAAFYFGCSGPLDIPGDQDLSAGGGPAKTVGNYIIIWAVQTGANEITVRAFLDGKIGFLDIPRINQEVLSSYRQVSCSHLEDYIGADEWGRAQATEQVTQL